MSQKRRGFKVVYFHLKLKKNDFLLERLEMHFVLLQWTNTLHKPHGW